jgi:hypothetical protein
MSEDRRLRVVLILGAVGGAVLSIAFTLLLDVLYADSLGGTWRDAISNDLNTFLSVAYPPDGFVVTVLFLVVILVLALFGALLGSIFSTFVFRLITLLTGETKAH